MEKYQDRLSRFLNGDAQEVFGTLLNSIQNYLFPQIRHARDNGLDYLGFLGTHATIQIVTEKVLGIEKPIDGTRLYLQKFVDGDTPEHQYTPIADDLHMMRNSIAHTWISGRGHALAIDYQLTQGWDRIDGTLHINPRVYFDDFLAGYDRIWSLEDTFISTPAGQVQKYRFIADWLDLPRRDPIRDLIKALADAPDDNARTMAEAQIDTAIRAGFLAGSAPKPSI